MDTRFNMLVTAAVLGVLVILLGSVYIYLYCTKFKKNKRWNLQESRVHHYGNVAEAAQPNAQSDVTAQRIKTHPFFIMRYGLHTLNKQASEQQKQSGGSSGSQRNLTPSRGFNRHLADVPE